jgi:hypothetical protein
MNETARSSREKPGGASEAAGAGVTAPVLELLELEDVAPVDSEELDSVVGGVGGAPAFSLLRWLCNTNVLRRSSIASFSAVLLFSIEGSDGVIGVIGEESVTPRDSRPSSSLLRAILSSSSFFLARRERFW